MNKPAEIELMEEMYGEEIEKDLVKYKHLKDDIKQEFKRQVFRDILMSDKHSIGAPDVVRNMVWNKAGLNLA